MQVQTFPSTGTLFARSPGWSMSPPRDHKNECSRSIEGLGQRSDHPIPSDTLLGPDRADPGEPTRVAWIKASLHVVHNATSGMLGHLYRFDHV